MIGKRGSGAPPESCALQSKSCAALFEPASVAGLALPNRIAFAPCTRQRAHLDGTPTEPMVVYYRQRAEAGLIVTEGIWPSPEGNGYLFSPGLCTDAHEEGWRRVVAAVHAEGGRIFGQIMHVGRLTDPLMLDRPLQPVSSSPIQPDPLARHYTVNQARAKRPYPVPRELGTEEVRQVVASYAACARRALRAGFDGVEIHAASGYLPMQFLSSSTNRRTDLYGGSLSGRTRFLIECVEAIQSATRPDFVAVKFSPGWTFHDVFDDDPVATYSYATRELSRLAIAYLQVGNYGLDWDVLATVRPLFHGPLMGVVGFTGESAATAIAHNAADLIAFGRSFIANPDLVRRLREDRPLNEPDPSTFYTQGEAGYTDYPTLDDALRANTTPTMKAGA